jgi:non-canonical purine NTP pyrophosphatase (RdgB/HAM1 family)
VLIATTNPGKIREIRRALASTRTDLVTLADLPPIPEPEETGRTFAENAALKARVYASVSGLPTVAEDSGLVIDALGGRPGIHSARYPGATYPDKFRGLFAELAEAGAPRPWTARYVCSLAFVDAAAGATAGAGAAAANAAALAGAHRAADASADVDGAAGAADAEGAAGGEAAADSAGAAGAGAADVAEVAGAAGAGAADVAAGAADADAADAAARQGRRHLDGGPPDLPLAFSCEAIVEGEITPEPRGSFGFGYDPIFFYPPLGRTTGELEDEARLKVSHRGKAFRMFAEWLTRR